MMFRSFTAVKQFSLLKVPVILGRKFVVHSDNVKSQFDFEIIFVHFSVVQ
jgi:hypothetical protein